MPHPAISFFSFVLTTLFCLFDPVILVDVLQFLIVKSSGNDSIGQKTTRLPKILLPPQKPRNHSKPSRQDAECDVEASFGVPVSMVMRCFAIGKNCAKSIAQIRFQYHSFR